MQVSKQLRLNRQPSPLPDGRQQIKIRFLDEWSAEKSYLPRHRRFGAVGSQLRSRVDIVLLTAYAQSRSM